MKVYIYCITLLPLSKWFCYYYYPKQYQVYFINNLSIFQTVDNAINKTNKNKMSGRPNSNIYSHKHMVLCDINPNSSNKDSVKFVTHEDFVLCDIDPARGGVRTVETDRRFSRLVDLHPGQMFAHFHAKINRAFESSTFNLSSTTSCSWVSALCLRTRTLNLQNFCRYKRHLFYFWNFHLCVLIVD